MYYAYKIYNWFDLVQFLLYIYISNQTIQPTIYE